MAKRESLKSSLIESDFKKEFSARIMYFSTSSFTLKFLAKL